MAFLWGLLVCILVGLIAHWYGRRKGKNSMENKALSLLFKLSELINEGEVEKAQSIIIGYTSGEKRIEDIILLGDIE